MLLISAQEILITIDESGDYFNSDANNQKELFASVAFAETD